MQFPTFRIEELKIQFGYDEDTYREGFQELAMTILKEMFGPDIPSPGKVHVTNWGNDKYSYGSYSFNKFEMKGNARNDLADPILKRVYIAGEATSDKYFGTTHGAYLSGLEAASKVLKDLL